MMMQMLAAAGLPAYTDEHRPPDEDNPRGYFEHEQATRLHQDASWIPQARGKAVKIVAHLLPFLPEGEQYRLIFMHRDMREVVASQKAMLERLGRKGGELAEARLMRAYTQQLVRVQTWLRRRAEIPVLAVSYAEALADPRARRRGWRASWASLSTGKRPPRRCSAWVAASAGARRAGACRQREPATIPASRGF